MENKKSNGKRDTSGSPPSDSEQKVTNNFTRIRDYLTNKYKFRLNIIEQQLEAWEIQGNSKEEYKELREENLYCELMERGERQVSSCVSAILGSDLYVTEHNPIKEYFKKLPKWDKSKPDHISKLANFVVAKNQDWFNAQFIKMLVRNVAAALGYIPFNKQCFVLTGGQSAGKSTFLRFLCPTELAPYYTEEIDFISKDGVIALTQNFLINLEELDKYNKTESGHIKTFMSKDQVKVRLPYAKRATRQKRIASFLGTTNQPQFLTDPTGNVRWLVMEIETINHDHGGAKGYNSIDIDLVYAQAHSLLKSGFEYKLTAEEIRQSEQNNKSFLSETTESGIILEYFEPCKEEDATHGFNVGQLMKFLKTQTSLNLHHTKLKDGLLSQGFVRKDSIYMTGLRQSIKGVYLVKLTDIELTNALYKNEIKAK